jgi:hypothetical protein
MVKVCTLSNDFCGLTDLKFLTISMRGAIFFSASLHSGEFVAMESD